MILTDYGFNLSATRQISINRNDPDKLNNIFSAVLLVKVCLFLFSFCLLSIIIICFDKFLNTGSFFHNLSSIIGNVLLPVWLFQGLEKMKYLTYIHLITKLFFTASIFIFVKNQDDYILVPLISAIGTILTGIFPLSFKNNFPLSSKDKI